MTAFNGTCEVSLDQRALDADVLAEMLAAAKEASERIAAEEGCEVAWEQIWEIEPIPFDDELIELADESIREVTETSHRLPSGPLHDAAEMARAMPTVMLFVKSLGGVSHTKDEDTPIADLELSVRALDELTRRTLAWAEETEATMDFGVTFQTDPPASRVVELTQRAEKLGFTHAWTFDSHILWQEPYVIYAQMLAATERIMVGPFVTNPATRDPTVTASLFATLNDGFGNRTICGIGRGDSARRVLGKPPTTLAETEAAMHVIKELAEGRAIETPAGEVRIPWVRDGKLDVWMAGYGPKALALVGRKADGFILQLADPVILRWTVERVRAAAEEAGRDPAEIAICVAAPAYLGDDLAHARDQCRWFGGMVGNHVADLVRRYGEGGDIPTALTDYIKAREGYDYSHHGRAGNPDTEFVPDEIVDRFCLLGTVDDHLAKLRELEALGVNQFNVYLMHDAQEATLDGYGEHVIPELHRR